MEAKVIGAGMMFLGSGCGPGLSAEQRAFLKDVQPGEFYPLERLLAMFEVASKNKNDLVYATGRRWGAAVKDEMARRGATGIKDALRLVCEVYQEHHQGDVGNLVVEDDGEAAVYVINNGPYPTRLIGGAFQAVAAGFGNAEATLDTTDDKRRVRVSWRQGDED